MNPVRMLFVFYIVFPVFIDAQIGINTNVPDPSAALDVTSTTQGFLPPRMLQFQRNAILNPQAGLMIWCIDCGTHGQMQVFNGSFWTDLSGNTAQVPIINCGTSTVTFSYNGNLVTYGTVLSAGRCWLDRNLGATQVATASNDQAAYGDLFQWGRLDDGHQIRTSNTTTVLANTDIPGNSDFIIVNSDPFDWRSPQNANLWQGVDGINNPCPSGFRIPTEAEFVIERNSWSSSNSAGAFQSPLKFPMAGFRMRENGIISSAGDGGIYWSSTTDGNNAKRMFFFPTFSDFSIFQRGYGFSIRCIRDGDGGIGALNCSGSSISGLLKEGIAASGVSIIVPYSGGNGGNHYGQTVESTGVTGLTATLSPGFFNSGSGLLTYIITGVAGSAGQANFTLEIGGQECILSVTVDQASFNCGTSTVTFTYNGTPVTYGTVVSASRCWLDRNLGATQVATSITDAASYGDLFQWGRNSDGHQTRTSNTTTNLSNTDNPGHSDFIVAPNTPFDWRNPQNNNLWQGVNSVNNPCPAGFRLPNHIDLNAEISSWSSNNAAGAFGSPLKLTMAGLRHHQNGSLNAVNTGAVYWSSTNSGSLFFGSNYAGIDEDKNRAFGFSVRCVKQ